MITTILFDVDGVILEKIHPIIVEKLQKLSGKSPQEIIAIRKKYWEFAKVGKINDTNMCEHIFSELSIDPSHIPKFKSDIQSSCSINQGILQLVTKIKDLGYKTALLSNSSHELTAVPLKMTCVDKYFDSVFLSHNIGFAKPSREIFDHVTKALGVSMDALLLIDDKEENVEAARRFGMKAILFTDLEKLKNDETWLTIANKELKL